ncbi:ABC transporter ATP-binding protein [Peterkaempfera bronchialis]|uniref:ABC transporter ATP-binding protein n=1 Tax=Peterkaempfera bronchialis TaxID=2126346 RepID=A0A345SS22_9ACTN|nr:ABC transporter ATP-binding protein [Peterkaempfera bronchialis]AXI76527.1 ABC transporter ATP-binding protein [Peterkaempfera bronchialis]
MTAPARSAESPPSPEAAPVRLSALTKRFGDITAVDGLSLSVDAGQVVALLGPNGAGKTTTIDMVLGLQHPDSGSVLIHGRSPDRAVAAGEVAGILQGGGLLGDFTVAETVRYVASLYADAAPVGETLERAGLTSIARRRVGRCSGGEQQRLRFALALVGRPRLLVLDEPTAGLDAGGRRDFWRTVTQASGAMPPTLLPPTLLLATHQLDEADRYADRIVVIRGGRVIADGTPAEIRNAAAGRQVTAVWPDADETLVRAVPGVESVERRGVTVTVRTRDSDAVVRYLMSHPAARDIEVTSNRLEEAFLALTAPDAGPSHAGTTRS